MFTGLLKYFPHALAAVAELSRVANDQHNPGQPVHWAKHKSADELDALLRHLTDAVIGGEEHRDPDGCLSLVKAAWRTLAQLERMADRGVDLFHVAPAEAPAEPEYAPTKAELDAYIDALNSGWDVFIDESDEDDDGPYVATDGDVQRAREQASEFAFDWAGAHRRFYEAQARYRQAEGSGAKAARYLRDLNQQQNGGRP